ncbi:MAG: hypothetical protein II652_01200 [Bacteroidales bacterium]|jgi:hypothetical protein|nr:hypothetical protein [Bacteroidales bacterium]
MKRLSYIIALAALTLILCSWTTLLVKRFEHFVDKVEKNAATYTEEDWEKANESFSDLMKEYDEDYDKCSEEQHDRIDKCIGRYHALVVKSGADDTLKELNEVLSKVSVKVRSILMGLGSFLQNLKN